jgi:hypothetical protein
MTKGRSMEKKEIMNNNNTRSFAVIFSVTVIVLGTISALCVYGLNERRLMASNIENAISKGIDPLSVRCSYAHGDDIICVTHAAAGTRTTGR